MDKMLDIRMQNIDGMQNVIGELDHTIFQVNDIK
jgi:hypothetical protein